MSTNRKGDFSPSPTIRERRLVLQVSQEQLARQAGCTMRYVQRIESGYVPGFSSAGGKSRVVSRIEAVLDELEAAA